jgi:hypothetical protein
MMSKPDLPVVSLSECEIIYDFATVNPNAVYIFSLTS